MIFDLNPGFSPRSNVARDGNATATVSPSGGGALSAAEIDQLIEAHLPLVETLLGKIRRRVPVRIDESELRSIGVSALVMAARRFEPARGRPFASYVRLRIQGAMLDELRRMDSRSRRARHRARLIASATQEIEQKHGREAGRDEVRRSLDLPETVFTKWVEEAKPVRLLAIDRPLDTGDGEGATLHELLADDRDETGLDRMEQEERIAQLMRAIEDLSNQQKQILALFYFEGMRVGEIARAFKLTPSRISQIHREAVETLREKLANSDLQSAA